MEDNYQILIRKLDEFIRKYYKNQLIRGLLYSIALLLLFFLLINIAEYIFNFGVIVRTVLFYTYILANIVIIIKYVLISLFRLFKIGKVISQEYAAQIIGEHFIEIKDKLLNTLQLKKLSEQNPYNRELIEAGINQKIENLKPVPFTKAVNFSINKKYIKYPLILIILTFLIFVLSPQLLTEPSERLIKHNVYFEKPNAFHFILLNKDLQAIQQEDFKLDIKITGKESPEKAYIIADNVKYILDKENNLLFHYLFKNLQKDVVFQIAAEDYVSEKYTIRVMPKPVILNFTVELNYPSYTGKKDEVLENTGDLVVPAGTLARWRFYTKDTRNMLFKINNLLKQPEKTDFKSFTYKEFLLNNIAYTINLENQYLKSKDSLAYSINIIPDIFPTVNVEELRDSLYEKFIYFRGVIKDDYGFSKLSFNYEIRNNDERDSLIKPEIKQLPFVKDLLQQQFYYQVDMSSLNVKPGQSVEYYFEVWDNDAINGAKSARSKKMFYKEATQNEVDEKLQKNSEQLQKSLEDNIREAKLIQKRAEELNKKLIQKKDLNWDDKRQAEDLIDKMQNLKNNIENIKNTFQKNNSQEKVLKKQENDELAKKQEELEKLFNELMTDEMKDLIKQYQDLLKEMNKDKINDMLDKIKLNNEDIEKQLNRDLDLLKQLEVEKKLNDAIDKLKELAQKQNKLAEESVQDKKDNQQLQDKQDNLNKEFNELEKQLKDLKELNQKLEDPYKMQNTEQQQNSINKEMQNSSNSLKNKNFKNASKSQKNAAEQMDKLADEMQEMKEESEQEQLGEDIDKIRNLLEDLIQLSFDQEKIMTDLKNTPVNDPRYIKIVNEQKKIKDDLQIVEDSLYAISKRQVKIKSFVNKKINEINLNIANSLKLLLGSYTINYNSANFKNQAMTKQQYIMTSMNDLALLLSESLKEMQQEMSSKMSSKMKSNCKKPGNCSKPGQGKPSAKSLRQMQQQLNKQLEKLKQGLTPLKNGNQQQINEQLARMAAEQEAIRQKLQQLRDELSNNNINSKNSLDKAIKNMEQTENELVNKIITPETLRRQQEILTRLLESEKAEEERETENKRQSTEAKDIKAIAPKNYFDLQKNKVKEDELLRTNLPVFNPFYKKLADEYLLKLSE